MSEYRTEGERLYRNNVYLRDVSRRPEDCPLTAKEACMLAIAVTGSIIISLMGLASIVKYAFYGCVWC